MDVKLKIKMKKILLVMFILCTCGVTTLLADCSWKVYNNNTIEGGWGLCISYTNECNFPIRIKITYEEANNCNGRWFSREKTAYYTLQPNCGNYWLIGNYGTSYDDCTWRYNVTSAEQVNN